MIIRKIQDFDEKKCAGLYLIKIFDYSDCISLKKWFYDQNLQKQKRSYSLLFLNSNLYASVNHEYLLQIKEKADVALFLLFFSDYFGEEI